MTSRRFPPQPFGRGLLVGAALGLPPALASGGCTTEDPKEVFELARRAGVGGAVPAAGGSSMASASRGGSAAERAGAGGSGAAGSEGVGRGSNGSVTGGANGSGEPATGGTAPAGGGSAAASGEGGAAATGGESAEGGESGLGGNRPDECGAEPVSNEPFTREALRRAAATCVEWHLCRFEAATEQLALATDVYARDGNDTQRATAQRAFRDAMTRWSVIELFQFGPLASRSETGRDPYHGQGIRDLVYAWPLSQRCRVEDQIASEQYASDGFQNVLVSSRGLYALEYALFESSSASACPAGTSTARAFETLGAEVIEQRRRAYASALAADVVATARRLTRAFRPEGENFRETFAVARGYPDEAEAMNVLAGALVYAERELKDWKLGIPAGYTLTHPVSGPESPFAGLATENIRYNLAGFAAVFQGCGPNGEGVGFDDWLEAAGHGELAGEMVAALAAARAAADLAPPLERATPAELETLYRAVKGLTDLLKTDLLGPGSPLHLELPAGVEGDTD